MKFEIFQSVHNHCTVLSHFLTWLGHSNFGAVISIDLACLRTTFIPKICCDFIMEDQRNNCVMCRRGFHNRRYQRHSLTASVLQEQPAFAAYVQENAVMEVSIASITLTIVYELYPLYL